jgi:hypothetical protein
MDKQRRLRSIEVIYASAVGYKSESFDLIHEVLQGRVDNAEKLRFDEALDYEEAVPIICLAVLDKQMSLHPKTHERTLGKQKGAKGNLHCSLNLPPGTTNE